METSVVCLFILLYCTSLDFILKAAPDLQTYTALLTPRIKDSSLKPPGLFPMSMNALTLTVAWTLEFSLFPSLIYAINKTHFWVILYIRSQLSGASALSSVICALWIHAASVSSSTSLKHIWTLSHFICKKKCRGNLQAIMAMYCNPSR